MKTARRRLFMLAATAAGSRALMACGGEGPDEGVGGTSGAGGGDVGQFPAGYVDLGPVDALPEGTLVAVSFVELLVGRDTQGVYAMTSRCTHQGCNMIDNDGIAPGNITVCGCHGSRFDADGVPIKGPAKKSLTHYGVIINNLRRIGVNTSVTVAITERAAVPA